MKNIIFLYLFLFSTISLAQQHNNLDKLIQKKKSLENMMASFSGKAQSIDSLISEGKAGLSIAVEKDYEYKFLFNSAIGTGYYYKQDFKLAMKYFEQAHDQANKAGLIEKSLKPLGHLVSIYHYLGLQNKADSAALKLKLIAESTDTLKTKSDIYYNLGLYNQQQKFYYGIALSNFLKSVELHKSIVDTTKILKKKLDYGTKLMMVAEIYLYLKQPVKALEYLNEVKPYLNLSIIVDVAAYGKFIRSYVLLNDRKQAIKYYNLLFKTVGKQPGKWSELVSSNLELASLELKAKNIYLAKIYLDKAEKQSKIDNAEMLTSAVNLAYGNYYKSLNDYKKASAYYKLAENGSSIYNKEQYSDLLQSLTAVEILAGNQKNAYDYFNKYVMVSDSLNQRKISLNLAEMEAKFQNESKRQTIGVLNKENEDKNIQLKQEKITRWLLIGGSFLLLVALFSIYGNVRNKQKANLLLGEKNKQLDLLNEKLFDANETKAKLFGIIAHDLRTPVSQLFTFLKLQQNESFQTNHTLKEQHQQKLMESSKNLLSTMEDLLLWSKSQMDHFEIEIDVINVKSLFNEAIMLVQNQAEIKNLEITLGNLNLANLKSDQNFLIIVLRNLLQNAINHAQASSKIYLNAGVNSTKNPYLSIVNQGLIIPQTKIIELLQESNVKSKSSGYGLIIVKELLLKLNATLAIKSDLEGTEFSVLFSNQ